MATDEELTDSSPQQENYRVSYEIWREGVPESCLVRGPDFDNYQEAKEHGLNQKQFLINKLRAKSTEVIELRTEAGALLLTLGGVQMIQVRLEPDEPKIQMTMNYPPVIHSLGYNRPAQP